LHAGQQVLDLGLDAVTGPEAPAGAGPAGQVVVTGTASQVLWQVLTDAYARLGFDVLGDEAFAAMVLARCVEPASKLATIDILRELGVREPGPSLSRVKRRLGRGSGTVLRTKVQDGLWRGRWTRSASSWGLRYRMDASEHARPSHACSRLPQGGRVPCGRGAGVRCPCRGMRPAHPRLPHRGPDGLQGSTSYVATSSQGHRAAPGAGAAASAVPSSRPRKDVARSRLRRFGQGTHSLRTASRKSSMASPGAFSP